MSPAPRHTAPPHAPLRAGPSLFTLRGRQLAVRFHRSVLRCAEFCVACCAGFSLSVVVSLSPRVVDRYAGSTCSPAFPRLAHAHLTAAPPWI